jgi:hypothetical protein
VIYLIACTHESHDNPDPTDDYGEGVWTSHDLTTAVEQYARHAGITGHHTTRPHIATINPNPPPVAHTGEPTDIPALPEGAELERKLTTFARSRDAQHQICTYIPRGDAADLLITCGGLRDDPLRPHPTGDYIDVAEYTVGGYTVQVPRGDLRRFAHTILQNTRPGAFG